MGLSFEWDARKAATNLGKHAVSFHEAVSCFDDPRSITISDPDHSTEEDRQILIGASVALRILVVCFTERDDTIRIISARRATMHEQREYVES